MNSLLINNKWHHGNGVHFRSVNPANQQILWQGNSANKAEVNLAVLAAKKAFESWSEISFEKRAQYIENYINILASKKEEYSHIIHLETGKPLWEARTETAAMIAKFKVSIDAYNCRTGFLDNKAEISSKLIHKPIGVMAVFGPFNFPGHLPNGHIIPALMAGNTIVFKPSEFTPKCAELMFTYWLGANLPAGVVNLVQGGSETGIDLIANHDINGVLFTGSYRVGKLIHQALAGRPEVMLALEMGGNNPLIIDRDIHNLDAAAYHTIQSVFITAGQRCTCARRLYVPNGELGDDFLSKLTTMTKKLAISDGHNMINMEENSISDPFMGTVINLGQKNKILDFKNNILKFHASEELTEARTIDDNSALLTPGIVLINEDPDTLAGNTKLDEECFGPVLQVYRYNNFDDAIRYANATQYGLAAGLFSDNQENFNKFYQRIRAGIVNWNRPTTGAASNLPFGGIGHSGNYRPSACYAADYCSYPMASQYSENLVMPNILTPGVTL